MVIYTRGFQMELRTVEDIWVLFFSPVLGGLFHRKTALTFLLRADLQQWSVNYGDLYVGFLNGNPFSILRVQALRQLMFTNETRCLLWTCMALEF